MKISPLNLITNYKTNLKNNNVKYATSPLAYDNVSFSGKAQKRQKHLIERTPYDSALEITKTAKKRKSESNKILKKANKLSANAQKISNNSSQVLSEAQKTINEYRRFNETEMLFRNQQGQKTSSYRRDVFGNHTVIKYDAFGNPILKINANLSANSFSYTRINQKNSACWTFENSKLVSYEENSKNDIFSPSDIKYCFNNGIIQQITLNAQDKDMSHETYFFNLKDGFKKCQRFDCKRREFAYYFTDKKLTKTRESLINSNGYEDIFFDEKGRCTRSEIKRCNIANLFDDVVEEFEFDEKGKPTQIKHNGIISETYV